jgi:uncharacterized protein YaaQ
MKLIVAIVQDEDAGRLVSSLMNEGYGVTKLATTGGFLRAGNTTLLIGVEDDKLEGAMAMSSASARAANRSPPPLRRWPERPAYMCPTRLRLWWAARPYLY